MPKVAFYTLGCKLNYAETSAIGKKFLDRGYEVVEFGSPADVCVINTCSVTGRADRESRQIIRRAVRTSQKPFVIVTGCYAQLEPNEIAAVPGVDLILGSREKFDLFDYVGTLERSLYPHVFVSPIETADDFGTAVSTTVGERTRAFLKIQDGCDYNCSFCTIPLARGPSRSQGGDMTVIQARELVAQGYKEIVLTGVNVGDYDRRSGGGLLPLLQRLTEIDGLERIRISSIEPNLITAEILDFVASSRKVCSHFHIPLQSGCDEILKGMRRRYTTGQYRQLVERIRNRLPDCAIGVDVIVGFPGETDDRFAQTCTFLNELPYSYLHVFTYSERPNTPAAKYPNHVEPRIRYKRNETLRMLGLGKKRQFYENMVGAAATVLCEKDNDGSMRFGFTDNYVRVGVPLDAAAENDLVPVRIVGIHDGICIGRPGWEQVAG